MGRFRILQSSALLLLLIGSVGAARLAARGKQAGGLGQSAQADAAVVLSSLLKRLEAEQQTKTAFANEVQGWCQHVKATRDGMADTVERKLEESKTLLNQIEAESKRLTSEANLVDANTQEKKEQATAAKDATDMAEEEFTDEQHDVSRTIEAVHHAIRLVSLSGSSGGLRRPASAQAAEVSAVSNLVQMTSDNSMTDAERQIMSSYISDNDQQKSGVSQEARQSLLTTLSGMLDRLQQEGGDARAAEEKEKAKLNTFDEHLQDALVQTTSERRALDFELAQRKRDHARFESQVSDLGRLLQTVKTGATKSTDACFESENNRARMTAYLSAEIDAVKTAIEQTAPENADDFLTGATPSSLSFLQVASSSAVTGDLRAMATRHPGQAALYLQAARQLEATTKPAAALIQSSNSSPSGSSSAIQDIAAFAADSGTGGSSAGFALTGESAEQAKATYKKLMSQLQQQQKVLREEGTWCTSILSEASQGNAAIARSLKQSKARLNLMKVAMLQYEKSSAYYAEQAKITVKDAEQLSQLTTAENTLYTQTKTDVSDFSKQLMHLGMEMGASMLAEDRRNADVVRGLVEKLEGHQNLAEAGHTEWARWTGEIEQVDNALRDVLQTDVEHNSRRVLQFKTESQFLQSMANSRTNDKALADGYQRTASKICPEGLPEQLQSQQADLDKQVKELQDSYNERFAEDQA